MKVFEVDYDDDEGKETYRRYICDINHESEILDAVIKAYPDGNYDEYYGLMDVYQCYRDNGYRFMLKIEE